MRNIIQKRKYFYALSIVLSLMSVAAISMWGLNLGLDFKGGTLMEVEFSQSLPEKSAIESKLSDVELKSLSLQQTREKGMIIRYLASDETTNEAVLGKLKEIDTDVKQLRVDFIGGSVSENFKTSAIQAIVAALIGIALFIAWAFRKVSRPVPSWQYGLGAIIALAHDMFITIGVFSVLGHFYGVEVGIPFVAAILTILGYSINDTIVVYDRTRENLIRKKHKEDFEDVVNRSLNETLARSFNTSLTVIIVLISIVLFGGESIRYFAVALLVGITFGTYSSIYVATALLVTNYKFFKR